MNKAIKLNRKVSGASSEVSRAAESVKVIARRISSFKKSHGKKAVKAFTQRVFPLGNGWIVKSDKNKTFTVVTTTQKEAISIARSLAQQEHSELVIHNKSGQIKEVVSYASSGMKNDK